VEPSRGQIACTVASSENRTRLSTDATKPDGPVVDSQPHVEVAKRFGSTFTTLRRLGRDCHAQYRAAQGPLKKLQASPTRGCRLPIRDSPQDH